MCTHRLVIKPLLFFLYSMAVGGIFSEDVRALDAPSSPPQAEGGTGVSRRLTSPRLARRSHTHRPVQFQVPPHDSGYNRFPERREMDVPLVRTPSGQMAVIDVGCEQCSIL